MIFISIMAAGKATTVRLDARNLKRVARLARAVSRSRSWLVNQALERYLEYEEWCTAEAAKGIGEAATGRVTNQESLVKIWERKRAAKLESRR